jgi:hypothetical protein
MAAAMSTGIPLKETPPCRILRRAAGAARFCVTPIDGTCPLNPRRRPRDKA